VVAVAVIKTFKLLTHQLPHFSLTRFTETYSEI